MTTGKNEFPNAYALLNSLPKASIMVWLTEYQIGRQAMRQLEARLTGQPQPPEQQTWPKFTH